MSKRQTAKGTSVAEILAPFPAEVRDLTERVRTLIKSRHPDFVERAYPGWNGIGYRDPEAGYVCGIFPRQDCVRLLFERGASLSDPDGLLQGDGTQTRFIVLEPGRRIPAAAIGRLLVRALHRGALS